MQRHHIIVQAVALASLGIAGVVGAGQRDYVFVDINDVHHRAQGTITDARGSDGTREAIGCYTTEAIGFCFAVDQTGLTRTCTTQDPLKMAVLRSMTSESLVIFTWAKDGSCGSINIGTHSFYKPSAATGF